MAAPTPPDGDRSRPSAPPRTMSNPSLQAVRTAARAQPLAAEKKALTGARLKEGAIDTVLNSFGVLGDLLEDFKSSDRFFKYKVGVLAAWLLLTVTSFGVACPGSGPSNDIQAHLVVSGEASRKIYMVKNESTKTWQGVEVTVNGRWRTTMAQLEPNGDMGVNILYDRAGKRAPIDLVITDLRITVQDPEDDVVLLKHGVPQ